MRRLRLRMDFSRKVSLITGASQGIGEAIAAELARCGAEVILVDIQEEKFKEVDDRIVKEGAMKGMDPEFTEKVKKGDIIVAGWNFGCGSGRETAVSSLKLNGISVVVAESFARMFFRNAIIWLMRVVF